MTRSYNKKRMDRKANDARRAQQTKAGLANAKRAPRSSVKDVAPDTPVPLHRRGAGMPTDG